ncbi:Fibrinogen C domain-containing protein 1 [Oryzias melastigma]|uniref:Fibrinogen C domain-containing protein 1 n=1 Tax=Oryzias melastigma TaxID=30732 RepID=A0A834C1H4_ORYME|nr:Fibrinogen C domain-containing protein 1 [Oryzias melastigma]
MARTGSLTQYQYPNLALDAIPYMVLDTVPDVVPSDGGRQSEQDSFISDEFGDMMCDREGSDSWWRDWSDSGLKQIHALTIQANYELRIDLEDFENSTAYAQYGTFGVGLFSVDPDDDGYPLTVGDYSGNAGDSLLKHNGMKFTTKDRDNDQSENNCASFYHGAWWYRNCHTSNLNGQYLRGQHTSYADGIEWSSWTGWQYSLKFSEMKIRPTRDPDNK